MDVASLSWTNNINILLHQCNVLLNEPTKCIFVQTHSYAVHTGMVSTVVLPLASKHNFKCLQPE